MKKLFPLLLILTTTLAYGQKKAKINFDIEDFNQKMEIAEWLVEYDAVAWVTSDSVMTGTQSELERLGSEWFCFQKDGNWHAVYGKYESGSFDLVFHYLVDDQGQIHRTREPVDTLLSHRYSRALQTANEQQAPIRDSFNLRFNQYIRENEDKTFTVWIFPAFQPNRYAVWGGEFIYTIDAGGDRVLKDDSYYQGQFKGAEVDSDTEVWLDYREVGKPTLGSVFFVWYYKPYFSKIVIDTGKSLSTAVKTDGQWSWIHAEKEGVKEKKKKKK